VYQRTTSEDGTITTEAFVCSDADFESELVYLKEKVDAGVSS